MKLIIFLCLTGLLPVSAFIQQTVPRKYDLILKTITWPDAQKYCRVMYNDLATMLSDTDWLRLKTETTRKGLTTSAWTGLYKDIYNWRWSLNNLPLKNVNFTDWYPGQPDNYYGNEACVIIAAYQQWYDVQCNLIRPFICYDARFSDSNKFIGISSPQMSWPDARTYCRTNHTALASSLNSLDDAILDQIKINQGDSWIGLTRNVDIWKRSDGTKALNPWYPGQPDNYYGSENCAVLYNNMFYDEQCTYLHYFVCQTREYLFQFYVLID
ncbi:C-type mannose receptor 2-like [Clarias gariepinus]|uniref:C-type mannose receptor 2-like n=1 Tax=Clarias gariepinus TaxID=13013 RepID=UPI00234E3162|nr:C-type mannose receptor 2-like [Clarias gariepinus]